MDEIDDNFQYFAKYMVISLLSVFLFTIITGYILRNVVEQFIATLYYPALITIFTLFILLTLIYRMISWDYWKPKYLHFIFLGFSSFNFFQLFNWTIANEYTPFQRPINTPFLYIADLSIPLIIIAVYLHFESLDREKHNTPMLALLGLLVSPYVALSILAILGNVEAVAVLGMLLPFLAIATIITISYSMQVVFEILVRTSDLQIRKSTVMTIIGLFFIVIAFVTQILTPDVFDFILFEAIILQLTIFAIGIGLMGFSYLINPIYLNTTRSVIYEMILFNQENQVLWSFDFINGLKLDEDISVLKFKVISSVMNLGSGLVDFNHDLHRMDFDENFSVQILSNTNYNLVVLVNHSTKQFNESIKGFFNLIISQTSLHDKNEEYEYLVSQYFPITPKMTNIG